MVHPLPANADVAHPKMPEPIKDLYEEARRLVAISPRSAAAVLRLCIEKLCQHLTGQHTDINTQIATLVQRGLPQRIQKALDAVRVIGNEAVHPGTLDMSDGETYVYPLFKLVNLIVENQIAEEEDIDELYALLPEGKRKGIEARDAKGKS
jgi:uncharacterized protein with PIN domain